METPKTFDAVPPEIRKSGWRSSASFFPQVSILASLPTSHVHKQSGVNLGDLFGPHLASSLLALHRKSVKTVSIFQKKLDGNSIALVGSILQALRDAFIRNPRSTVTVAGCGLMRMVDPQSLRSVLPRMRLSFVRGHLTAEVFSKVTKTPRVITDPGLLLSDLHSPAREHAEKKDIGFVVHSVDRDHFAANFPSYKDDLIDNYSSYPQMVEKMSEYRSIVSTSLHGVIFAHSYGIPVTAVKMGDRVWGGDFKFADYYSSFGHAFKGRPYLASEADLEGLDSGWNPGPECVEQKKEELRVALREVLF